MWAQNDDKKKNTFQPLSSRVPVRVSCKSNSKKAKILKQTIHEKEEEMFVEEVKYRIKINQQSIA